MHLKDLIKKVILLVALVGIIVFALSKFNGIANDNMNTAIDNRDSMVDTVNNA